MVRIEVAYTDYIPVVITGSRQDYSIIIVAIVGGIPTTQFYNLIEFLKSEGFHFDGLRKLWVKKSSNLDEDMNTLENYLIDHDIPFMNRHPLYFCIPSESYK